MRLLQPKLMVLYLISKKTKVRNNISELGRLLGYQKDSWMNNMIHSLLDDHYIESKVVESKEYLVLTKAGKRKIAPLTLSRYFLPLMIGLFSIIPIFWATDELITGIAITPLPLLVAGAGMLFLSVFLYYEVSLLERDYFRAE